MVAIVPAPARLPVTYEQACVALAECVRIDECKNWSDKAEALASYARQRDDRTLVTMAMKIAGRAMRRCGELLEEIKPAKAGRPLTRYEWKYCGHGHAGGGERQTCQGCGHRGGVQATGETIDLGDENVQYEIGRGAPTNYEQEQLRGRAAVAQAAGLSKDQRVQALRIANVPAPVLIERPKPATLTELADVGKKTAPRPAPSIAHLHGADPKDY
jgi:hypothetical protein